MSFSDALFTLLIGPLKTLFELIYIIVYKLTCNPGFSIVGLSLVMNLLLLPLYNQTDAIQMEAIETDKRLKPYVTHIKKTFKGNEQFMMLQTCYRQNHYKPTDAIKGISPLLLEIPFFMAAYNYLSGLSLLSGAAFGPITNLGAPDGLLHIGGMAVNVLPILMTVINLLSSLIYTKDAPLKTKLQLYGMAALFLIVLYDAPAGLAFYWTLNNLFSLVKNIFIKMKNPRRAAGFFSSAVGLCGLIFILLIHPMNSMHKQVFLIVLFLAMQLPLALSFVHRNPAKAAAPDKKGIRLNFFTCCAVLTILLGVLIPSSVIKASPAEFVDFTQTNPLLFILHTFLLAAGMFLVWLPVFFMIANSSGKRFLELAAWLTSGIALMDYMFFGTEYGTLSPQLDYLIPPAFSRVIPNALAVVAVIAVACLIYQKRSKIIRYVCGTLSLAILMMSVVNVFSIQSGYQETVAAMNSSQDNGQFNIIPLSKKGKNVMVLMMDRAISSYIPYFMNEKPELKEKFAGFTYFPNTISFGAFTNAGTPALYGGYEYTPENINRRSDVPLVEKQNEALKVMPVNFDQNDFTVTVCDPSYAGYQWIPDLSIYDEYPDITAYHTIGQYNATPSLKVIAKDRESKNRSFFYYSLFRSAPVAFQPFLYNDGKYNSFQEVKQDQDLTDPDVFNSYVGYQERDGLLKATGMFDIFMKSYNVLDHLPELTRIEDSEENTFLMMSNDVPHEPMLLQEPEYIPAPFVDNTEYEASHSDRFLLNGRELKMENEQQVMHYQVNMCAMLKLAQWFDFMRDNDVYDNTRIIIVSDHGRDLKQLEDLIWGDEYYEDIMFYNPLLMVKDFGSKAFTTDNTFMTNADVPSIAFYNLIGSPVNPFSGRPISSAGKAGKLNILLTPWDTEINNGSTFIYEHWIQVDHDAKDTDKWTEISPDQVGK